MGDKYLIVEGPFDKTFYEALLEKLSIKNVKVTLPRKESSGSNGKQNAIDLYVSLVSQMMDGTIDKLCLVVDSDFASISKQGFQNTVDVLKSKLSPCGFDLKNSAATFSKGLYFKNNALQKDIALWVMPNNKDEGYLEFLLFDALGCTRSAIVSESNTIVNSMKNADFPEHHQTKAKLAVAMAMLENPGRNVSHLVQKDILGISTNTRLENLREFISLYFA